MVELVAQSPCGNALPVTIGRVSMAEVDLGPLTLIQPFESQAAAMDDCVKRDIGLTLPKSNRSTSNSNARLIWFGHDSYLLAGGQAPDLTALAAVSDQSDAWACVEVSGDTVEDVLARLVPVDLRASAFPMDATVRTLIGHISAALTRTGDNRILILVFRSMARSLVEDLKEAMEAVAARG